MTHRYLKVSQGFANTAIYFRVPDDDVAAAELLFADYADDGSGRWAGWTNDADARQPGVAVDWADRAYVLGHEAERCGEQFAPDPLVEAAIDEMQAAEAAAELARQNELNADIVPFRGGWRVIVTDDAGWAANCPDTQAVFFGDLPQVYLTETDALAAAARLNTTGDWTDANGVESRPTYGVERVA